ncbi:hypothetical protein Ahy_B05g074477 [Arachis hypogaea]|uniref:PB1-like domain-containing protein n=1 Tax=Arachis hypogaea TaxID=3818 RepID=A0A444YZ22_ARAHY|nr:hypothetical protein Ahy_B05g074477 [Arachis hypogaea]
MVYFKLKVYHGGFFIYRNGSLEYVGGETTVIEEIDGDRWSVFEAYAELRQFGYVQENIPSLWFKDPTHEDLEKHLKLFKTDADSIAMCKIAELRDYVDLYVVHKVEEEDVFPASGYIDVGGDHRMDDEGQQMVLYGGEHPDSKHAEAAADISGAENNEGGDDVNLEADMGNYNDSDSVDSEYKPSEEEEETEDDSNFTNSEDELDPDVSRFQDVNVANKKGRAGKMKGVATDNFGDEDVARSDELENDHESARAITFRKCDLQRVRAVCTGECPFWVYAAKMKEEDTWHLRSMNLSHTCTQAHRVGIMHSRWLGKAFKKKVSSNPKVKIRELVSKAQKKWNLTVTKSMATRTKQIALDEIQGTFRE